MASIRIEIRAKEETGIRIPLVYKTHRDAESR